MQCGTPVEDVPEPVQTAPVEPAAEEAKTETPAAAQPETDSKAERVRPSFDEFQWDVSEYPNQNAVEKTDDINFNWNTDPAQEKEEIPEAAPQKQEYSSRYMRRFRRKTGTERNRKYSRRQRSG